MDAGDFLAGFVIGAIVVGFLGSIIWDTNTVSNFDVVSGKPVLIDDLYYQAKAIGRKGIVGV